MWLGAEDLDGKTILVAADEGLGDTIQFVRYVPMLAERGARVLLVVQDLCAVTIHNPIAEADQFAGFGRFHGEGIDTPNRR